MRAEIKANIATLQLEAKEVRRKKAYRLLIVIASIALSIWFILNYPQFGILIFVPIFGALYIIDAIDTLYHPLKSEFQAFQKIADAIITLEKSKEDIFYEEAYRCVNKAYKILKSIELKEEFGLYDWSNEVFRKFLENLDIIILPAIKQGAIIPEHLESIALAIYETDTKMLELVNSKIEGETSYTRGKPSDRQIVSYVKKIQENKYGKIVISLALGYGLVLTISLIYVVLTQQDFAVFSIENPEIIILGGLAASGVTILKIK